MTKSSFRRPKYTARNKMMDLLARRDHSEKEIRKKLKDKFTPEEIETAIQYGKEHHWIPETEEDNQKLAEKTANALHRKNKGINYINNYLHEKGLPEVHIDNDLELEKARTLVKNKRLRPTRKSMIDERKAHLQLKAKLGRFLMSRGFDMQTVRKVLNEK